MKYKKRASTIHDLHNCPFSTQFFKESENMFMKCNKMVLCVVSEIFNARFSPVECRCLKIVLVQQIRVDVTLRWLTRLRFGEDVHIVAKV